MKLNTCQRLRYGSSSEKISIVSCDGEVTVLFTHHFDQASGHGNNEFERRKRANSTPERLKCQTFKKARTIFQWMNVGFYASNRIILQMTLHKYRRPT